MKLYYGAGACSMGIHFLLNEIGKPFELERVDLLNGAQYKAPYVGINPKSKVPALELDDGTILTEFPAIAYYLARVNPEAGLLPEAPLAAAKAVEVLEYLISTVHMRGFTRVYRPGNFTPSEADFPAVKAAGLEVITKGFALLEPVLGEQDYILGEFSIVEGALFFLEVWCRQRIKLALPANFEAHLDRLLARPAAQKVLSVEGLA